VTDIKSNVFLQTNEALADLTAALLHLSETAEQKKQEQDLGAIRLYRAIHAITTNKEDLILLAELVMKTNAEIKILKKQYDRHIRRKPQDVKELRHIAHYLSKHPIENQE